MKRLVLFLFLFWVLVIPCFGSEKEGVVLEFYVKSSSSQRTIAFAPKIMVADGKEAIISVGNEKTALNGKKVGKGMDIITKIKALPKIVKGSEPTRISLLITFYVKRDGGVFEREYKMVLYEGVPFEINVRDPQKKSYLKFKVTAYRSSHYKVKEKK